MMGLTGSVVGKYSTSPDIKEVVVVGYYELVLLKTIFILYILYVLMIPSTCASIYNGILLLL